MLRHLWLGLFSLYIDLRSMITDWYWKISERLWTLAHTYLLSSLSEHYLCSYLLVIDRYCVEHHSLNLISFFPSIAILDHHHIPLLVSFHPESVFSTACAVQNGASGQIS